jgi:branched-chain amino acid transport system permease protein
MNKDIRTALILGAIGGFVTFIFGGWSVSVLGVVIGIALGLTVGAHIKRTNFTTAARQALSPAILAAAMFLAFSLFQNYVVAPAIGKASAPLNRVLTANLAGILGLIVLAIIMAGFHGLSKRGERLAKLIVIAALVIAFPFVDYYTDLRWTAQIIFALIFVILGLGLNIVVGFAGLLDLGYAAFFAIGAYTAGLLSSTGSILYFKYDILLNFWIVIWIAAIVAAISGILLGSPTLPLRGDYLAIVTLGFGEIIPVVFRNLIDVTIKEPFTCWILPGLIRLFGGNPNIACITIISHEDITAGEKGINPISRPSLPFIGEFQSDNPIIWYFLIIAIILLSIFLIRRLRDSRLGRAWMAIREDELAAAQMGINPVRTKLLAFSMGATFSGFAGAFYAAYIRGIFPSVFDFSVSIIVLVTIILGGLGNINGVIVGGLIITTADRLFLPALKDFLKGLLDHTILPALASNPTVQAAVAQNANPILYRFLLFGLTLVIMMAVRPEGLIPSEQIREELHADENEPAPAGATAPAVESGTPK